MGCMAVPMMINMTLHRFGIRVAGLGREFVLATIAQFGPPHVHKSAP